MVDRVRYIGGNKIAAIGKSVLSYVDNRVRHTYGQQTVTVGKSAVVYSGNAVWNNDMPPAAVVFFQYRSVYIEIPVLLGKN
jgi:hypothetical protein